MRIRAHHAIRPLLLASSLALILISVSDCSRSGTVYTRSAIRPTQISSTRPLDKPDRPLERSIPRRLLIPKLRIDVPVIGLGLNSDHTIEVPPLDRPNLVGWWDGGPTPGENGASVILGHNVGGKRPSVFEHLGMLEPGDLVTITRADGSTAVFAITQLEQVPKNRFPTARVYGMLSYPGIRLITCGGRFDTSSGHHVDNIIAYGKLVRSAESR